MFSWLNSFRFAAEGLCQTVRTQRNFRVQLALGALAVAFGAGFRISPIEWTVLVLTIVAVLSAELLNTALEALVDLVSPETHPLAKQAKDCAAAAVLVMALGSVVIGLILFLPRLYALVDMR